MSRFWGWFERIVLVGTLLMMTALLSVVVNEAIPTMSQEMTEVFAFVGNILGLFVVTLLAAVLTGLLVDLAKMAVSARLGDHAEWTLNCIGGLGGAAIIAYHVLSMSTPYSLNPEFAQAQFLFGWTFVLVYATKARPVRTALMLLSKRQERKEAAA